MTYSHFDPAAQNRVPWNFDARIGPKRPFNQKQIWAVRLFLDREQRIRDRALFDLAIDSKLRGSDLVELKIGDFVSGPEIRTCGTIFQLEAGQPVQFEIAVDARGSLFSWLELKGGGDVGDVVFPNRVDPLRHLSARQHARLADEWVVAVGLQAEEHGVHSPPATKASIIQKATGNKRTTQLLLGHSKIENTVRFARESTLCACWV